MARAVILTVMLMFCATRCFAISFVQDAVVQCKSCTSISPGPASAFTAGNACIAVVSILSTTVTVSSVGSSTNSACGLTSNWNFSHRKVGASTTTEFWYALNVPGGGAAVTFTLSASSTMAIDISEFSGVATASAADVTATNSGTSATASTGSNTTTNGSDVVVGSDGWKGTATSSGLTVCSGSTGTWNALKDEGTVGGSPSSNVQTSQAYQLPTATGTFCAQWTLSASSDWSGGWLSLKAAGGGGATIKDLITRGVIAFPR